MVEAARSLTLTDVLSISDEGSRIGVLRGVLNGMLAQGNSGHAGVILVAMRELHNGRLKTHPEFDDVTVSMADLVGVREGLRVLASLFNDHPAICDLFFSDKCKELWITADGENEQSLDPDRIRQKSLECLIEHKDESKKSDDNDPVEQKFAKLVRTWERDCCQGRKIRGRLPGQGHDLYWMREDAIEFLVWLKENPKKLGKYQLSQAPSYERYIPKVKDLVIEGQHIISIRDFDKDSESSMRALFEESCFDLYRYFRNLGYDGDMAKVCVQEVFMYAFSNISDYEVERCTIFEAWVFSLANKLYLRHPLDGKVDERVVGVVKLFDMDEIIGRDDVVHFKSDSYEPLDSSTEALEGEK